MAGSYSAEVWLDSYRWDALEAVLERQGSSIEQHLQNYLLDLYQEMVPADQVREIESRIEQDRQEELREAEARKVFSAFRLWEGGKSRCLAPNPQKNSWIQPGFSVNVCGRETAAPTPLPGKSTAAMKFLWIGLTS